ncbi:MAG: diaminopimelate epimerase [Cyclobacteriaceae bacterium]|jgi:diaminopimelate epimerase
MSHSELRDGFFCLQDMLISFSKYQGTGNDFILIDDRELSFPSLDYKLVRHLTDRHFGIGSDGLMLIQNDPSYDFKMVFFNPDGSHSMCGNGSRCATIYAQKLGIINDSASFITTDGVHKATIAGDIVHLSMHDVDTFDGHEEGMFINTGSPHHVSFCDDLHQIDILTKGRSIRYHDRYKPNGTNVNFAEIGQANELTVRTYERGVESETLSCGTGVTAAALCSSMKGLVSPVKVITPGGRLTVSFTKTQESGFKNIMLSGPATWVYDGQIEI